jgi:hypothetical protein
VSAAPDSLARWAVAALLCLAASVLLALITLWAEDVRAMRTVPRGWPHATRTWHAMRRAWLTARCWASEARFYLTVTYRGIAR